MMKKLVVVDDEPEVRSTINVMLSGQYDIKELETVNEVIEYCKKNSVDLIITDLFMPEKSGLDLIESIKEMNYDVKLLAVSGGSRINKYDFLPIAELMGAHGILHKPFTPNELRGKVRELLN